MADSQYDIPNLSELQTGKNPLNFQLNIEENIDLKGQYKVKNAISGQDSGDYITLGQLNSQLSGLQGLEIGSIFPWITTYSQPDLGFYILCDGRTYDTSSFPQLFAKLGTNRVPDLRGLVLKGYDGTNKYTTDASLYQVGQYQGDTVGAHSHPFQDQYQTANTQTTPRGLYSNFTYMSGLSNQTITKNTENNLGAETRVKSFICDWYIVAKKPISQENIPQFINKIQNLEATISIEANSELLNFYVEGKQINLVNELNILQLTTEDHQFQLKLYDKLLEFERLQQSLDLKIDGQIMLSFKQNDVVSGKILSYNVQPSSYTDLQIPTKKFVQDLVQGTLQNPVTNAIKSLTNPEQSYISITGDTALIALKDSQIGVWASTGCLFSVPLSYTYNPIFTSDSDIPTIRHVKSLLTSGGGFSDKIIANANQDYQVRFNSTNLGLVQFFDKAKNTNFYDNLANFDIANRTIRFNIKGQNSLRLGSHTFQQDLMLISEQQPTILYQNHVFLQNQTGRFNTVLSNSPASNASSYSMNYLRNQLYIGGDYLGNTLSDGYVVKIQPIQYGFTTRASDNVGVKIVNMGLETYQLRVEDSTEFKNKVVFNQFDTTINIVSGQFQMYTQVAQTANTTPCRLFVRPLSTGTDTQTSILATGTVKALSFQTIVAASHFWLKYDIREPDLSDLQHVSFYNYKFNVEKCHSYGLTDVQTDEQLGFILEEIPPRYVEQSMYNDQLKTVNQSKLERDILAFHQQQIKKLNEKIQKLEQLVVMLLQKI